MTTQRLYRLADARQIPVFFLPLPECGSISLQDARGRCAIGMDSGCAAQASERVHLAHELGHCLTGSLYNCQSPLDLRQKHENHADKWAISALIPRSAYQAALADGCTELWQLAERFGVTEDFARKAVCWYRHGNLASDLFE